MATPSRKPIRTGILQRFESLPITDPIIQSALDRLRKNRGTKKDRELLGQVESRPNRRRGKHT